MENYFEILKKKICDNIDIEKIEVIDNTYLHKKHKEFQKNKYHLKLIIKSDSLRNSTSSFFSNFISLTIMSGVIPLA